MKYTWTQLLPVGEAPCQRSSHGISMIDKDTLILYGGEHVARTPIENEADAVWICSNLGGSQTANWKKMECAAEGKAPPSRVAHAQVVYKNRYLYIFGGRAGITMQEKAMNDLWVLDTEGDYTWTQVIPTNDPPEARSFHRMICLGGSLYVFGGCGDVSGRLADLHKFDMSTSTWHDLGSSSLLRGRGGPSVFPIKTGTKIAIVAGFAGEETKDGHCYDVVQGEWEGVAITNLLEGLRPRSVCCGGTLASVGVSVMFGGEVDPSDRGHEGAGGFENDIVVLSAETGAYETTVKSRTNEAWPQQRGWADAEVCEEADGVGHMFLFGGLSGNDEAPERLDDLWRLDITQE